MIHALILRLVDNLENEVILPQGDSELDYSNFLVNVGLTQWGGVFD